MARYDEEFHPFLSGLGRTLLAASRLFGDPEKAKLFVAGAPLQSFSGSTAVDLMAKGKVDEVLRYIDSLEAGFIG